MPNRAGFSLIELVVVVLILGILAGVAAPRLFDASGKATDNGLRQSLFVVRDAIALYAANNAGKLPGADNSEVTFKANLSSYLREFPENAKGANPSKLDRVRMISSPASLASFVNNDAGWVYNSQTGEFRANNNAVRSGGVGTYFEL